MYIFALILHIYTSFTMMRNKVQRQSAIRKMLTEENIHSQEYLLKKLKSDGFNLTQATLSRDLKTLKVAKVPDHEKGYKYIIPDTPNKQTLNKETRNNLLADGFKGIEFSGNMGVIKTLPGYASSIASVIDNADPWEIIGTIAGDDTILIILKEGIMKNDIINTLILIMPNLKEKIL